MARRPDGGELQLERVGDSRRGAGNGPTAALNQDGRMEAFDEGTDTTPWYIEQTAPGFSN